MQSPMQHGCLPLVLALRVAALVALVQVLARWAVLLQPRMDARSRRGGMFLQAGPSLAALLALVLVLQGIMVMARMVVRVLALACHPVH